MTLVRLPGVSQYLDSIRKFKDVVRGVQKKWVTTPPKNMEDREEKGVNRSQQAGNLKVYCYAGPREQSGQPTSRTKTRRITLKQYHTRYKN
jgi:hypothetical protein